VSGNSPIIRINRDDGPPEIFEFESDEWGFVPGGDGLAVIRVPITGRPRGTHRATCIPSNLFVTPEMIQHEQLGAGEDVFMIGRFVDHDGGSTNMPTVRFGNISAMPTPIALENWPKRDLYCIDMHSRSGYSGSPVIVFRTFGQDLSNSDVSNLVSGEIVWNRLKIKLKNFIGLLGVHVAQFPETFTGKGIRKRGKKYAREFPIVGVSGMTIVVPAWRITEALEQPKMVRERAVIEAAAIAPPEGEEDTTPRLETVASPHAPTAPLPRQRRHARKRL
jgi:hypothetical protein